MDRSVLEVEHDGLGKQDIKRLTFLIWSENFYFIVLTKNRALILSKLAQYTAKGEIPYNGGEIGNDGGKKIKGK